MVSKWEIYYCSLDPTLGSEQKGTRPVLIVSNNAVNHILPIVTVLPLSKLKPGDKIYPSEVLLPAITTGLPNDSIAMVQQVRTVAHTRFTSRSGRIDDPIIQEKIRQAIRDYFEV